MPIGIDNGHEEFKKAHAKIMCRYVGDGRRAGNGSKTTIAELTEKTRSNPRTLKSWKLGDRSPIDPRWLALTRALGPHYLNDVLRFAGFGNATPINFCASTAIGPNHAQYELAMRMQSLSAAMLDGHVDHVERAQLIPEFEHLISMLNLFVWGLKQTGSNAPGGATQTIRKD